MTIVLPPPRSSPPPTDGLRWALWEGVGSRAVAVVDLGDGPRWLRALHACARAPLLLWRAPDHPQRGSAPRWLEHQRSYVLAARDNTDRLYKFLIKDTAEAIVDNFAEQIQSRDLQLSSSAPVVLAVGQGSPSPENESVESLERSEWFGERALRALWRRHQSFRGLFLHESVASAGLWRALAADLVTFRGRIFTWNSLASADLKESSAGSDFDGAALMAELAALRTLDLGGFRVRAFSTPLPQYKSMVRKLNGVVVKLEGHDYKMMLELSRLFNFCWYLPKQLRVAFNSSHSLEQRNKWYETIFIKELWHGNVDFSMISSGGMPVLWSTFDVLTSTVHINKILVLIPHAPQLPAWSLTLRVFGSDIWCALLVAVVAYALAWRVVAGESLAESVAAALRVFSSCGGPAQDRVRTTPQRLQLASALFASAVVITSIYQGRLFTLITQPEYAQDIDSLAQLGASGLPLASTMSIYRTRLLGADPETFSAGEMAARAAVGRLPFRCITIKEILADLYQQRHFAWLLEHANWRMMRQLFRIFERLRPMKEEADVNHLFLIARRNWPWTAVVNRKIMQFQHAGLPQKWSEDFERTMGVYVRWQSSSNVTKESFSPTTTGEESEPRMLELEDVLAHVQLLTAGLALAAVTFCAEVWYARKGRILRRSEKFGRCSRRNGHSSTAQLQNVPKGASNRVTTGAE